MVFLLYATAAVLALVLLYFYHTSWYWHVLSVAVALAIGMVPPELIPVPASWGPVRDLTVGFVFVFLLVWGLAAVMFRRHHVTPHAPHHV
jgi:hypothetical protein